MTYRDDRDADRARIEALESELAAANAKVADLEGRRDQALVLASRGALAPGAPKTASERWFGAPLELMLSRELAGSYPIERCEEIIERLRELTRDPGRSEVLRSSLTWQSTAGAKSTGPFIAITVTVRDGVTRVVASDRLGQAAGAVFGGIGGGVGGGAIVFPVMASVAVPVLAPLFIGGWLAGSYFGTRAIFKRVGRRRAIHLQQVLDAVCDEISRAL